MKNTPEFECFSLRNSFHGSLSKELQDKLLAVTVRNSNFVFLVLVQADLFVSCASGLFGTSAKRMFIGSQLCCEVQQ